MYAYMYMYMYMCRYTYMYMYRVCMPLHVHVHVHVQAKPVYRKCALPDLILQLSGVCDYPELTSSTQLKQLTHVLHAVIIVCVWQGQNSGGARILRVKGPRGGRAKSEGAP